MKTPEYPLEQIAQIKLKRLEEAEKILKQKKEALAEEEEKLEEAQKKLDKVRRHKAEKVAQFIKEMNAGTTSTKIEIHDRYIKKVVDEDLNTEKHKVEQQKKVVTAAETAVEEARKTYIRKSIEVEKMKLHRIEWEKEVQLGQVMQEVAENDELGSNIHSLRKRKHGKISKGE